MCVLATPGTAHAAEILDEGDTRARGALLPADGPTDVQRELPYVGDPWGADEPEPGRSGSSSASGDSSIGLLLWILLVPAALFALTKLRRTRVLARDARVDEPSPTRPRPLDHAPLDDAEALAREGRLAEAVHVLLLRTLVALARATGRPLAPGTTSREFAQRLDLDEARRSALDGLVLTVELSLFGGREPDAEAFGRCSSAYRVLVAAWNRDETT